MTSSRPSRSCWPFRNDGTAHTGTLFLDEIGDLPLSLQAKLLGMNRNVLRHRLALYRLLPGSAAARGGSLVRNDAGVAAARRQAAELGS